MPTTRFSCLGRLLAVLAAACVGWLLVRPAASYRWSSAGATAAVHPEEAQMRKLDADLAATQQRLAWKEAVLQDLIADRKSLLDVAGPLFVLQRQQEARFPAPWRLFPELPAPERACRLVIHSVEVFLSDDPERARAVCARLEEEFQCHLDAGTLHVALGGLEGEVAP
jgi:hypothetical protein